MPNPPKTKPARAGYVQSSLRIPQQLRDALLVAAEKNGRSLNAEILARLEMSPLEDIKRQNEEIKTLVKILIDRA